MNSQVWIVYKKEFIDNLRDKRSLILALFYPLIGAVLLGFLLAMVGGMLQGQKKTKLQIPILGAENAPQLIAFLEDRNVEVVPAPKNPQFSVREGRVSAVLIIPKGAQSRIDAEEKVQLEVIINPSRVSTIISAGRISRLISQFGRELSKQRLAALNISSTVTEPIEVKNINVGRTRNLAGLFISMMPPFIMFAIFVGGVYLAVDTTAGERERGSLEPLLTNPISRGRLMLGKALTTFTFTTFTVVLQLLAFKTMFYVIGGDAGVDYDPPLENFLLIFLICLPLVLFAVAVQIIIATYSRSYKETQTYLALLPLIPSLPGMVLVFVPISSHTWMMFVPTFGQVLLIGRLVQRETVLAVDIWICCTVTFLFAAGLLYFAKTLYNKDRVLFGAG